MVVVDDVLHVTLLPSFASFDTHTHARCRYVCPFLFLFIVVAIFDRNTSYSENDHITLYLNMIRVDYRLVCSHKQEASFLSITIYCCIPFSVLSKDTTTVTSFLFHYSLFYKLLHLTLQYLVVLSHSISTKFKPSALVFFLSLSLSAEQTQDVLSIL